MPFDVAQQESIRETLLARTETLNKLFVKLDATKTGTLEPWDVRNAFLRVGIKLNDEELRALVLRYDVDGDGRFRYSEFADWMRSGDDAHFLTTADVQDAMLGREVVDIDFQGEIPEPTAEQKLEAVCP